jgi:hypothetical protein
MKSLSRITAALLLATLLTLPGCAISRTYVAPRDALAGESHNYTTVGFLWNIIPASPVDVGASCSAGVQKITTRRGFFSVVVNVLTGGLVIPTQVTVTCLK